MILQFCVHTQQFYHRNNKVMRFMEPEKYTMQMLPYLISTKNAKHLHTILSC